MTETTLSTCDDCGALVPLEQLSLVEFSELWGLCCEACKRETVVVSLTAGPHGGEKS